MWLEPCFQTGILKNLSFLFFEMKLLLDVGKLSILLPA